MNIIFRKVSTEERLPKEFKIYFTWRKHGNEMNALFYDGNWTYPDVTHWLERIELPVDNQIWNASVDKQNDCNQDSFIDGAKWMRDFVLAGKAVAPLTSNTNSH